MSKSKRGRLVLDRPDEWRFKKITLEPVGLPDKYFVVQNWRDKPLGTLRHLQSIPDAKQDDPETILLFFREFIVEWNFRDDQGDPYPIPSAPEDIDELPTWLMIFVGRSIWEGVKEDLDTENLAPKSSEKP